MKFVDAWELPCAIQKCYFLEADPYVNWNSLDPAKFFTQGTAETAEFKDSNSSPAFLYAILK